LNFVKVAVSAVLDLKSYRMGYGEAES